MSPTHAALEVGAVAGNPFAENIVPRFDDSDLSEGDDEAEQEEALKNWKVAPQAIAGRLSAAFSVVPEKRPIRNKGVRLAETPLVRGELIGQNWLLLFSRLTIGRGAQELDGRPAGPRR